MSVNHLQFYLGHVTQSRAEAVEYIKREVKSYLKRTERGWFLVVHVGDAKAATLPQGVAIDIIFTPQAATRSDPAKLSHTSIFGLPVEPIAEIGAAADLLQSILRGITADDIYLGCEQPPSYQSS